jgi:hypothetical protein
VPPGSQATYAERGTELTDFNLSYAYVAVATRSYLNLNRRLSVPRLVYRFAYNGDRARQLPMRVNIRLSSIREDLVPEGHLKVAHHEVVGRVLSKATRPARDDRLAACAREAVCEPRTEVSFVPPGRSYL